MGTGDFTMELVRASFLGPVVVRMGGELSWEGF